MLADQTLIWANENGRCAWMESSAPFRRPPARRMLFFCQYAEFTDIGQARKLLSLSSALIPGLILPIAILL